jgi:hypothetical protein
MTISIYCSGSIQKGTSDNLKLCWTVAEKSILADALKPLDVRFLNPDDPLSDMTDTAALFGRDLYQVQVADFVVVDARERRGIGIGIEMLASRMLDTPLVVVAPSNTHYRRDELTYRGTTVNDYIHPHLRHLADVVVENFESAGRWIKGYLDCPIQLKTHSVLYEAIEAYRANLLPIDPEMLAIYKEFEVA